jgi:hypothetical protein
LQAIIVQSFIATPARQVWDALHQRTDVLFDGLPAKAWPDARQEQPPAHLHTPWPFTAAAGAPTEVSVTIHDLNGSARVDVRHVGWGEGPAWDAAIQGHFAGWLQGLAALGLLLETGVDARVRAPELAGRERYFISGEIPAAPAAVYRSLTDPAVLASWSDGLLDGARRVDASEDRYVRWRLAGNPAPELVAVLRLTPRGTHLALAEFGTDRSASARWPGMFERLAVFLK